MSVGLRGTTRSGLTASSDRLSRVSPSLDVLSFSEDEAVLRRGNRASLQSRNKLRRKSRKHADEVAGSITDLDGRVYEQECEERAADTHLSKPFNLTPTKFLQRIPIMAALLSYQPNSEAKLGSLNKDELKCIYVYAMPTTFLNKAHEVNFNVKTEAFAEFVLSSRASIECQRKRRLKLTRGRLRRTGVT